MASKNKRPALLILMRHGESSWNQNNLFTGWVDIPLSQKGIEEALEAGRQIKTIPVDLIFTSTLIRAQMSAFLAMSQHTSEKIPVVIHPKQSPLGDWGKIYGEDAVNNTIPVYYSWELNERMYGELQGLNKAATRKKFGDEQVQIWRRSYQENPPGGESLSDTVARALPYFEKNIVPHLIQGKNVFISAHGNSLRAITMSIKKLSQTEVTALEIPTGVPLLYQYTEGQFVSLPLSP